jgi:hypothetical protein
MSGLRKIKRFRFRPPKQKENERVLREGEFSFACPVCGYSCFRPGGKHCPRCLDNVALRLELLELVPGQALDRRRARGR